MVFIIMARGLQLGEAKNIIGVVMETIVPQEFFRGMDNILERSILGLAITMFDWEGGLEKIEGAKYTPFVWKFDWKCCRKIFKEFHRE